MLATSRRRHQGYLHAMMRQVSKTNEGRGERSGREGFSCHRQNCPGRESSVHGAAESWVLDYHDSTPVEVSSLAASWSGARTGLSLIEPDPGLVLVN
jgi:hypothetical protein